jgi:hypothetical protein
MQLEDRKQSVELIPSDSEDEGNDNEETPTSETPTEEEEEEVIIRAKWIMDGAKTIDEAVHKIKGFIVYLESLKEEGWELRQPINDDYGFLYKDAKPAMSVTI